MMKLLKRILNFMLKVGIISLITLMIFELCYRNNVVDFYKAEILALNSKKDLQKKSVDLMANKTILNFSIPGTGIKQLNVFAKQKVYKYKPKTILYQIYVGNDLLDVEKFKDYNNVSMPKYLFWQFSNLFLSLPYLNHKANILKPRVNYIEKTLTLNYFTIDYYNKRSKHNILINPNYLEQTVNLNGRFEVKYNKWLEEIKSFLNMVPENTEVYFVWIPHCSQVNDYYIDNFKQLNAIFKNKEDYLSLNYTFFKNAKADLKSYKKLKHINILPVLRANDKMSNKKAFYDNDPHLNKFGNDVLANYLNTTYFNK